MKIAVVLGVLAVSATAYAQPKKKAQPPLYCMLLNNTDHAIAHGTHPLGVAETTDESFGATLKDGTQELPVQCTKTGNFLLLTGPAGAVKIQEIDWFDVKLGDAKYGAAAGAAKVRKAPPTITITATAKKASVTVDGKAVTLVKGKVEIPFDDRAIVLATDFVTLEAYQPYRPVAIPVEITATAGPQTVHAKMLVNLSTALDALRTDLRNVDRTPVAWAAAADPKGPAIAFDCTRFQHEAYLGGPSRISDVARVVLCAPKQVEIAKCPASTDKQFIADGARAVYRTRIDGEVALYEAKTGKKIATTTLEGSEPGPCRDTATQDIEGHVPELLEIQQWMDSLK